MHVLRVSFSCCNLLMLILHISSFSSLCFDAGYFSSGYFSSSTSETVCGRLKLAAITRPRPTSVGKGHYKMSAGVCLSVRLSVCHVRWPNSRMERPIKSRIGNQWTCLQVRRSKVTRPINAVTDRVHHTQVGGITVFLKLAFLFKFITGKILASSCERLIWDNCRWSWWFCPQFQK